MKWQLLLALTTLFCPLSCFPQILACPQSLSSPLVFAHYMLITRPPEGDYSPDIDAAIGAGIDAFALNYGGANVDYSVQEGYLADFYCAAQGKNIKLFLSFDTTSTPSLTAQMCIDLLNQYSGNPATLFVDGKMMISSFQTSPPGWNWTTDVQAKVQAPSLMLPGTLSDAPSQVFPTVVDGVFTWIHPTKTPCQESDTDSAYAATFGSSGKKWMAAIAPWYFKRLGSDNWSQAQDEDIFVSRFQHLLTLKPDFIELVTWNDWGESTYFGPADVTQSTLPLGIYYDNLDHSGFLAIASKFIKAYKAGAQTLTVDMSEENVFMFYRLQPGATTGANDGSTPLPLDANYLKDEVYVVSLLACPADVAVTSGGHVTTFSVGAGVAVVGVKWTLGVQSVKASRGGNAPFVNKCGGPEIRAQLPQYNGNVVIL